MPYRQRPGGLARPWPAGLPAARWLASVVLLLAAACLALLPAEGDEYSPQERAHWSLVPPRPGVPPEVAVDAALAEEFVRTPIDPFILQRLTKAGLAPSPQTSRRVLIRRLSYQLRGLPPEREEIAAFEADEHPDAYERLVDRLLADPRYGEAWAVHWLDVVRYAESEGFEYDRHRPGAWRYRDWVIQSFNADLPYDRFVLEQVAGDELSAEEGGGPAAQIAAGFHRLGPVRRNAGNSEVAFSRHEVLTEMTDAIGLVFLGLTLGCARCHDHMFDPIRQRDYYALQALLAATNEHDIPLADPETVTRWKAEHDAVQAEITRLREQLDQAEGPLREQLAMQLKAAQRRLPPPLPTISSVHDDPSQRTVVQLLYRGQTDQPRGVVEPRFLGVLLPPDAPSLPRDLPRPRLALARWLIDPAHPLTARVYVNRLWQYQFGQGLVATPNDFGVNGSPPSHPELLDFLAHELIRGGWSTKHLQRLLVTSGTFRQSSEGGGSTTSRSAAGDERKQDVILSTSTSSGATLLASTRSVNPRQIDPDNRLLWHYPRRRLTAEELRDTLLCMAGRLEGIMYGPSVMVPVPRDLVELLYDPAQWQVTPDTRQHDRRSIYLVAKRNLRLPLLELFDQPDLQTSCARRQSSTHAPQALELLNGELTSRLADEFAQRLRREGGDAPERIVEQAFWLAAGRPPTAAERALSLAFLEEQGAAWGMQSALREFALAVFNVHAMLYVP